MKLLIPSCAITIQRMRKLLLLLSFSIWACNEKEVLPDPEIATRVPSVSLINQTIRLKGTIDNDHNNKISDHGFVYGTTANLTKETGTVVSLGPTVDLGDFDTEITLTIPGIEYHVRMFVTFDGKTVYGDDVVFSITLLQDFLPKVGIPGAVVTIIGNNFHETLANNVVKINGKVATVLELVKTDFGDELKIKLPTDLKIGKYEISVEINSIISKVETDNVTGAPKFEIRAIEKLTSFPGTSRILATMFVINDALYVLGGANQFSVAAVNEFWKYDLNVKTWTRLPDFPGGARGDMFHFTKNGFAYVGCGYSASNIITGYHNDFWRFDASNNSWFRLADFPAKERVGATAFVVGDFAYAGLWLATKLGASGFPANDFRKDFFKYDISNNQWSSIPDYPGDGKANAVSFEMNGLGYVGEGSRADGNNRVFFKFNPVNSSWTAVTYPLAVSIPFSGAFVSSNNAYMMSSPTLIHIMTGSTEAWELKQLVHEKEGYLQFGSAAVGNGVGYFGLGLLKDVFSQDIFIVVGSAF